MITNEQPITSFDGDWAFLSNFYVSSIRYCGFNCPTLEHAYQMAKCSDWKEMVWVLKAETPGQAKRRGQKVKIREDWEESKILVMKVLIERKFSNPELAAKLLATGDAQLIEGNHWGDRFWGQSPVGNGENWLGKLLMKQRDKLRDIN